jgi:hypothetical protein
MTPDLTDDDKAILVELLRETIERDRFPLSPRIKRLKAVLAKVRSAGAATGAHAATEAAGRAQRRAGEEAPEIARGNGLPAEDHRLYRAACRCRLLHRRHRRSVLKKPQGSRYTRVPAGPCLGTSEGELATERLPAASSGPFERPQRVAPLTKLDPPLPRSQPSAPKPPGAKRVA